MKREELFEEIGKLDADLLEGNVAEYRHEKHWGIWLAAAACLAVCIGGAVLLGRSGTMAGLPTADLQTTAPEETTETVPTETLPDFHTVSLTELEDLGEGMHYRLMPETCGSAVNYQNIPEEELPLLTIEQAGSSAKPDYATLEFPVWGTALSGSWGTAENGDPQFNLDGGGFLRFLRTGEYTLTLIKMSDAPASVQALEGASFTARVDSWQPFAAMRAEEIAACEVNVGISNRTVSMTAEECRMLATWLQEVRIVQRDQTGIVYYGGPIFGNLTLQDGTEIRIAADGNRFFVNDRWFFVDDDGATNAIQKLLDDVYD